MESNSDCIDIIWVRHSVSEFNEKMKILENSDHLDSKSWIELRNKVKFSKENIDSGLSESGIQLIYKVTDDLNNMKNLRIIPLLSKVEKVYLSPLNRCVQSFEIFNRSLEGKLKEQFDNLPVFINPLLFEKIEDSCDICCYLKNQENAAEPNFQYMLTRDFLLYDVADFSTINYDSPTSTFTREVAAYDDILINPKLNQDDYINNIIELMMLLDTKGVVLESQSSVYSRIKEFKKFLWQQRERTIIVFCHENFIKTFLNRSESEEIDNFQFIISGLTK